MCHIIEINKNIMKYDYWAYSMLTFASIFEMASKALLDSSKVAGQGSCEQRSTTCTTMDLTLHGLFGPLMHLTLYFLPQDAPLSHNPSLTAANNSPGGN